MRLFSNDKQMAGIWKAMVMESTTDGARVYIPALHRTQMPFKYTEQTNPPLLETDEHGYFINDDGTKIALRLNDYPVASFCCWKVKSPVNTGDAVYVMFENGDANYPVIMGNLGKTVELLSNISFGSFAGSGGLLSGNLSIEQILNTDLKDFPHLTVEQLEVIIEKFWMKPDSIFHGKTVKSVAADIYKAQQETGLSALISLGIGAQESGWGVSNIAHEKNNIWGWGAYNDSPGSSAITFSNNVYDQFVKWNNNFLSTYYEGYGAKTLHAVGTGENPAGKGYAYINNTTINKEYPKTVASIISTMISAIPDNLFTAELATISGTGSAVQQKIVEYAKTFKGGQYGSGSDSSKSGRCEAWIEDVIYNVTGYEELLPNAKTAGLKYGVSSDLSNIPLGACIWAIYDPDGHAGIYIGDGKVVSNLSGNVPYIETVDAFKSWASRKGGFQKMVWGWFGGRDLSK